MSVTSTRKTMAGQPVPGPPKTTGPESRPKPGESQPPGDGVRISGPAPRGPGPRSSRLGRPRLTVMTAPGNRMRLTGPVPVLAGVPGGAGPARAPRRAGPAGTLAIRLTLQTRGLAPMMTRRREGPPAGLTPCLGAPPGTTCPPARAGTRRPSPRAVRRSGAAPPGPPPAGRDDATTLAG